MSLSNGGPIKKDRCGSSTPRDYQGNGSDIAGMFYNRNAGDPTKWTYEADLTRPARNNGDGHVEADPAPDGAGHAAKQVEHVLGRADQ